MYVFSFLLQKIDRYEAPESVNTILLNKKSDYLALVLCYWKQFLEEIQLTMAFQHRK